ncbi:Protein of unknown function [Terribacillus aidingensis]|uniref:Deacetylase PdaC domain-containing protein n=1 Tax=Terribacillus aidingensis TaxID=586416 RepID=A0A285MZ57_9BACI|nr:DUF3298 and DUF4163 domain-containing protein [Terribacillus aidingensis]SNZ02475.1 Protein of unknown function [Terribacillus aidingensis]
MKKIIIGFLFLCAFSVSAHLVGAEPVKNVIVETEYYDDIEELKFPQVKHAGTPKLTRKINKDFKDYIEKAAAMRKQNEEAGRKYGYKPDFQTEFEVKYNTDGKLSILMSSYIFTGGAHGSTVVESYNYDLMEKQRVYLTDILQTPGQQEKVKQYVYTYAKARPEIFYPDLKKEDIPLDEKTAFFYTDNGIALVFQQYDIAPYVSGNQVIKIPKKVYS